MCRSLYTAGAVKLTGSSGYGGPPAIYSGMHKTRHKAQQQVMCQWRVEAQVKCNADTCEGVERVRETTGRGHEVPSLNAEVLDVVRRGACELHLHERGPKVGTEQHVVLRLAGQRWECRLEGVDVDDIANLQANRAGHQVDDVDLEVRVQDDVGWEGGTDDCGGNTCR